MQNQISFYEDGHKYIYQDKELISVSKLVKMFEASKNWDLIAKKYAKKNGGEAKDWQNKWREKAEISTRIGTMYHSQREEELLADEHPEFFGVKCGKLECEKINGVKYSMNIENLPSNTIFPELIVYDLDYGVCGQIDQAITTLTHVHIKDFKTDKEISYKAFSSQWVKPEKLLPPLQHLDNCNANIYSIKMSMYMYMLCKKNKHLKPGKILLEHISLKRDEEGIPVLDENNKPIVLKIEEIELPYRKMEVIDILKHYKSLNNGNREDI